MNIAHLWVIQDFFVYIYIFFFLLKYWNKYPIVLLFNKVSQYDELLIAQFGKPELQYFNF